jgi:hypothetical protein
MAESSQKPPTGELSGTAPEVKLSPLPNTSDAVKKVAAEGNPAFRAMGLCIACSASTYTDTTRRPPELETKATRSKLAYLLGHRWIMDQRACV